MERADARRWVINHQLGRRNVTPEEAACLRGEEYLSTEKHQGTRVDLQSPPPSETSCQSDRKLSSDVADRLAKQRDVSPRIIKRDARCAESPCLLYENLRADGALDFSLRRSINRAGY